MTTVLNIINIAKVMSWDFLYGISTNTENDDNATIAIFEF